MDFGNTVVFMCGPSNEKCMCRCAEGGPCDHVFDGPEIDFEDHDGCIVGSVTCSKCSLPAFDHSLWVERD